MQDPQPNIPVSTRSDRATPNEGDATLVDPTIDTAVDLEPYSLLNILAAKQCDSPAV